MVVDGVPLHGSAKSPRARPWMNSMSQVPVAFGRPSPDESPTTAGLIALINLESQIDSLEAEARLGVASVESQVALTELITLRGLILGRISDFERAEECAGRLLRNEAPNASAFWADR